MIESSSNSMSSGDGSYQSLTSGSGYWSGYGSSSYYDSLTSGSGEWFDGSGDGSNSYDSLSSGSGEWFDEEKSEDGNDDEFNFDCKVHCNSRTTCNGH